MEIIVRLLAFLFKIIGYTIKPFLILFNKHEKLILPSIKNDLLKISVIDLANKIRLKEITSEEIVLAYIERIKEVNPILNAVVENRFAEAIVDAKAADELVQKMPMGQLQKQYPILGVPFTVKESCSLKGMSYSVGSLKRKGIRATKDGEAVSNLIAAGAIPLLISNTPEFCTSWESSNFITGRTLNPYNTQRSSGGSSGGEGALIGAGASLFGVGSDVAGSIRIPALFNGIFGHKPTGGVISIAGHFPYSSDECFTNYLVIGPMCRYAKDLPTLVQIMAGEKTAAKLRLDAPLKTRDIKIYYMEDAGFSLVDVRVQDDIKMSMWKAIQYLRNNGIQTRPAPLEGLQECMEYALTIFYTMKDIPSILRHVDDPKQMDNVYTEILKSIFGKSQYTWGGLFFCFLMDTHGFIPKDKVQYYLDFGERIKGELLELLGDDGVLFYPTFPVSAIRHNESYDKLCGVMYAIFFNLLGFPCTHVPMGLDKNGLPIGFQIVAAPYQDRLCMCIAAELENSFGGWKEPPPQNQL